MSDSLPVAVRRANQSDMRFVTSSWLKSFRDGYFANTVGNTTYYPQQHKVLEQLIPRSTVIMAVSSEDPDHIFGWICYSKLSGFLCLHYIYVKQPFRGHGLARRLLKLPLDTEDVYNDTILHSHQTSTSKAVLQHRKELPKHKRPEKEYDGPRFRYNPYLLFQIIGASWNAGIQSDVRQREGPGTDPRSEQAENYPTGGR